MLTCLLLQKKKAAITNDQPINHGSDKESNEHEVNPQTINSKQTSKKHRSDGFQDSISQPSIDSNSTTQVQVKVFAHHTSGLAIAGSMHSLPGGVCHSIGDQSLGTLMEDIDPFIQLDVDTITVKTMHEELVRLDVHYTGNKNKDQLNTLLQQAHKKELSKLVSKHYRQYKGAVYDILSCKDDCIIFCCTKYKVGEHGVWMNNKACRKIIKNSGTFTATDQIHCPGKLSVTIINGKLDVRFSQLHFICVDVSLMWPTWTWEPKISVQLWR